jgi:hypothetical protein
MFPEHIRKPCILREGLGFSESVSFPVFAKEIIQDDDAAKRIAEWLLVDDNEWLANEDQPEYIERYYALDINELEMQMEGYFYTANH